MIPYFELPHLSLPLGQKIDIFGVLSAAGVVTGATLANRQARKYWPGNDLAIEGGVTWMVMFGLFGGHWMHLFAYHPELLDARDPWYFLRFWDGLSSMGGVLGALVGIFVYFRRIKTPILPFVDALALGAAPGWAIARIGCFLVHDHPGTRTDFPLAVDFPVAAFGGPRHDLGLYDMFALAIISGILWAFSTRRPREGRIMGLLAVLYSTQRFFTDFLRASDLSFVDRRYFGLTPAQYVVMGLFLTGVWLLTRKAPEVTALPAPVPAGGKPGSKKGR
jgi:phosphatidylglycerol:prolipoprotein diacylglycerol transferase